MSNEANVWQPRQILELSGDTKTVEELIVATDRQTLFTLQGFAYSVGTGALTVYKNGLLQVKGSDWVEQSSTSFTMSAPCDKGDKLVAIGRVGITANVDVRDTDIFLATLQNLRDYGGSEVTVYVQGGVTRADGRETMFSKVPVAAAPGTYVDDDESTIVPTGGDGSIAWLKEHKLTKYNAAEYTALTFSSTADLKLGLTLGGASVDFAALAAIQATLTVLSDTYTIKTDAQATADGDGIDGKKNFYVGGGTDHAAILVSTSVTSKALGDSSDATLESAVEEMGTSQPLIVTESPTYTKDTNFKGRPHSNYELPYKINSFTKTVANLGARMWVDGNVLYECVYVSNQVVAYSLEDPRKPTHIASYSVGTNPRHVTVSGRYMFVISNGEDKLKIYEIDSILAPALIGEIIVGEEPKMCLVQGDIIHVVCGVSSTLEKYRFNIVNGVATIALVASASVVTTPLAVASNGAGILAVVGLSSGTITLVGERNYNVIANTDIGGGAKSTCEFISKSQLLVASPGDNRVYSVRISSLSSVVTGFTATVADPEQLLVVGSRAYVPSLTSPPTLSKLSCLDITNGSSPYEYKQLDLSVSGGGFGAYYDDGETGYIYVNGHFAPYNIDVIEVLKDTTTRTNSNRVDRFSSEFAGVGTLNAGSITGQITNITQAYAVKTSNYTIQATDNIVRAGAGTVITMTLPDPASMLGKMVIIVNIHDTNNVIIANAFTGFSGTLAPGASIILLAADNEGVDRQWDAIANYGTIT